MSNTAIKHRRHRQPRNQEQKEHDATYHLSARKSGKAAKRSDDQKQKYAAARRMKRVEDRKNVANKEVSLKPGETEPQGKKENIEFNQADQSALPVEIDEVEPDPTAWLDHLLDDPVLADDRNETPNM